MAVLVLLMLAVCIGVPLSCSWRVWRLDAPSRAAWLLVVADAAVLVTLVLLVGRWDMAGYYVRPALVAVFLAVALWSAGKHLARPWRGPAPIPGSHGRTWLSLVLFGAALAHVTYGLMPPDGSRALTLPLQGGRFMVGQGGAIGLLNHHAGHGEQRYAADIVAIGASGFRAAGLLPEDPADYAVYGATVLSPCDGKVLRTRSDLPDLVPPQPDRDHPRGNHVVIDCGGFNVELAHLQPESLGVSPGDTVSAGDAVGRVGNSGNTTEPHLHIHAVDPERGVGLPMTFEGRSPVRNRLFEN